MATSNLYHQAELVINPTTHTTAKRRFIVPFTNSIIIKAKC